MIDTLKKALELKPADFCEKGDPEDRKVCPHGVGNDWCAGTWHAENANKIISTKIDAMEKSEVFMCESYSNRTWYQDDTGPANLDTHRALLICAEKIDGGGDEK